MRVVKVATVCPNRPGRLRAGVARSIAPPERWLARGMVLKECNSVQNNLQSFSPKMSDHRAISNPGKADAVLIELCRKGDADAWNALFDKYYPVAARFVFQ